MKEEQLVLCYVGSSQQGTPPMAIVGIVAEEDSEKITIKGPVSSDIAYFSLVGNRLKPLMDTREIHAAKEDKSMRALPQLAPSDFVMLGCTDCISYIEATMVLYKNQIVYSTPLSVGSSFQKAYMVLMEQIEENTALASFFNESVFDFDGETFLRKLMDPSTVKDVLVPIAVGAGETPRSA